MCSLNKNIDFSRFVSLGDSLTAGYEDGALFYEGQIHAYPNLIAEQLHSKFQQPLMNRNSVGIGFFGNSRLVLKNEMNHSYSKLSYLSPQGDSEAFEKNNYLLEGPFNNLGVPGAKAITLIATGYGDKNKGEGNYNPFFLRMASNAVTTSILLDAMKIDPTFFSLFIGNNDVMAYALLGGTLGAITPIEGQLGIGFEESMNFIINTLTSNGAKGIISNLPSINSIPHFNTINYNDLLLDIDEAKTLNTLYKQEGIKFNIGHNAFLIEDSLGTNDIRQIEKGELILLEILLDQNKNYYLKGLKPIPKKYYLSKQQVEQTQKALNSYNTIIKNIANKFKLALVDANYLLKTMKTDRSYNASSMSLKYKTRGVFSLDGLHINKLGQALLANEFIKAINHTYGTHIHKINITKFRAKTNH